MRTYLMLYSPVLVCSINIAIAIADTNFHSVLGWLTALVLFSGIIHKESKEKK